MKELSGIRLKGEADFLRRYNNKVLNREKRITSIKIKGLHIFFIFVLLGAIGFVAYKAGKFILTWEKLNIKSFKLINVPKFESKKVENILKNYEGNILSLDLKGLRKELMTLKQVKDVSLSRKLLSTIEIRFVLRRPVFQVMINNMFNLIDDEGEILHSTKKKREGLITIKNIKLGELEKVVPYLPKLNRIKDSIDFISFKMPYGVLIKLKGIREVFYPGDSNFVDKINYYLRLRKTQLIRNHRIKCVDLRFKDRFYLEFEKEVKNKNEK